MTTARNMICALALIIALASCQVPAAMPTRATMVPAANASTANASTAPQPNRYAVLFRVQTAKKPETRARNIARLVEMLARHEKIHP